MSQYILLRLAALGLLLAPATAFAEDDTPPWLDDGEDDEDDEDSEDKDSEEAKPKGQSEPTAEEAPAPAATPSSTNNAPVITGNRPPVAGGKVGLGFGVGSVNGFSLKLWPHRKHAMVLHIGAPSILNSMAVLLSYRATLAEWAIPDSGVTVGVNLGPNFRTRFAWFTDGLFLEMAGGVALGATVSLAQAPVEIYMEVIPSFGGGVSPANTGIGFSVDGLVGARFYVGK